MRLTQFLNRCVSAAVVELHQEGSARRLRSRLVFVAFSGIIICLDLIFKEVGQNQVGLKRV